MRVRYAVSLLFLATLLVGVCLALRSSTADDQNQEAARAVKWEYKVVHEHRAYDVAEKDLNALGMNGWELAGTISNVQTVQ